MRWWLMQHMYAMCWKDWNVNDLKCFLARFFSSCKKNGRRWWCVHHEVCIIDWGHHPLLTPRTSSCWISSTASSWAMTSINKSMLQLMLHVQWLHLLHTQTSIGQMFKLVLGNFLTSPLSLILIKTERSSIETRNQSSSKFLTQLNFYHFKHEM